MDYRLVCVISTILGAFTISAKGQDEPLPYHLTDCVVAQITVEPDPGRSARWSIAIRLKSAAADNLATLTADNIGRDLEVVHGSTVLIRARIVETVDKGVINAVVFQSEAAAQEAGNSLRHWLSERPCLRSGG